MTAPPSWPSTSLPQARRLRASRTRWGERRFSWTSRRADAGARIAAHVAQRGKTLYGIVHNAGITRDKMLVNTDADRWASVLDVNLAAQMRINEVLLDQGREGRT